MGSRMRMVAIAAAFLAVGLMHPTTSQAQSASVGSLTDVTLPPQVLGLIASAAPIPLICEGGVCTALVSSFCLQEDRLPPSAGQIYDPAGAGLVTLVLHTADGGMTEVASTGLLSYASEGDFTRMRIALDQTRLASLDAAAVSVKIDPMVSLLPRMDTPVAAAVVERDLDAAHGAPRFMAENFFAPGTPRSDAAVTMTRMISLLPASGAISRDPVAMDSAKRDLVWKRAGTGGALTGLSPTGVGRAKAALDRCGQLAEMGFKLSLRGCLESSHDRLMREVNEELWKSQPGY
ncbi:MAG: hypothetical protein HQ481_21905 [Alphaproteobacteria bacterium]|nr:hypothetical protein [Alphaproteobacteria bacterium]